MKRRIAVLLVCCVLLSLTNPAASAENAGTEPRVASAVKAGKTETSKEPFDTETFCLTAEDQVVDVVEFDEKIPFNLVMVVDYNLWDGSKKTAIVTEHKRYEDGFECYDYYDLCTGIRLYTEKVLQYVTLYSAPRGRNSEWVYINPYFGGNISISYVIQTWAISDPFDYEDLPDPIDWVSEHYSTVPKSVFNHYFPTQTTAEGYKRYDSTNTYDIEVYRDFYRDFVPSELQIKSEELIEAMEKDGLLFSELKKQKYSELPERTLIGNILINGGFEYGVNDEWSVTDYSKCDLLSQEWNPNDALKGDGYYHFWSAAENRVEFTLEQTADSLRTGNYRFSISIMGGDAGKTDIYAYAKINGEIIGKKQMKISSYKNWDTVWIEDIPYVEGQTITVGIYVKCSGPNAWGMIDEAKLFAASA